MTRRAKEQRQKRLEQKRAAESPEEIERRKNWSLLLQQIDGGSRPRSLSSPQVLTWNSSHAVVGASGKFELPVRVDCEIAELSYAFETKEMDIYFSITMESAVTGETRWIIPPTRCASHEATIRGTHEIQGPGNLVLVWDNEYSWINSKQLGYRVDLTQKSAATISPGVSLLETELLKRQRAYKSKNETYDNLQSNCTKRLAMIETLEQQLEELQRQLQQERDLHHIEAAEAEKVGHEVDILASELAALSWRTLPPSSFELVLSFCSPDDLKRWWTVNKAWHASISVLKEKAKESAEETKEIAKDDPTA
ncbi:hypothetical protein AeMF1_012810 [Aphanomyces euteiches]|nr:hypothetical protein AeMF1_012810 [Aphanomyces euteiches]